VDIVFSVVVYVDFCSREGVCFCWLLAAGGVTCEYIACCAFGFSIILLWVFFIMASVAN
jgi:hypothetical protein